MIGSFKLAIRYAILAAVATFANITIQEGTIYLYHSEFEIGFSIFVGTAVGLLVKYLLDKRYIFRFKVQSRLHDSRTFVLYTIMGLLTTGIFWSVEWAFHWLYGTKAMRYAGGILGLLIGYLIKYQLDRKYVFKVVKR